MKLSALILVWLGLALAEPYPKLTDPYVNDFAGILTPEQAAEIQKLLGEHSSQNRVEIVLVTLPSLAEYGAEDTPVEVYARELFNHWGIGGRNGGEGILLFFSRGDREARIELGTGYPAQAEQQIQDVMDSMLPYFKAGAYGTGLLTGAQGLVKIESTSMATRRPPAVHSPLDLAVQLRDWTLAHPHAANILFLLVLGVTIFIFRVVISSIIALLTSRRPKEVLKSSYSTNTYYSESSGSGFSGSGSSPSQGGGRSSGSGASGSWGSSSSSSSGGHGASGKW